MPNLFGCVGRRKAGTMPCEGRGVPLAFRICASRAKALGQKSSYRAAPGRSLPLTALGRSRTFMAICSWDFHMPQAHIGPPTLMQLKLRERLWHQAGKRCHWCGHETLFCLEPVFNQATVDHIVPRCRGGSSKMSNCVSSCFTCNAKRNREDQTKADHPSNKPSEKQKLRRSRDEALTRLQKQIEINVELSSQLVEYQTMSLWAFLRSRLHNSKRTLRWF